MKREIKFRAWDNIEKRMVQVSHLKINRVTKDWMAYFWDEEQGLEMPLGKEKRGFELMQYTGLKDKNGKEIYEGDIVRSEEEETNREVEWYEEAWLPFREEAGSSTDYRTCEVIGNIYQDRHLLKNEKK